MTATLATSDVNATNDDNLGNVAASYARLDIANNFSGSQSISGNESVSGAAAGEKKR